MGRLTGRLSLHLVYTVPTRSVPYDVAVRKQQPEGSPHARCPLPVVTTLVVRWLVSRSVYYQPTVQVQSPSPESKSQVDNGSSVSSIEQRLQLLQISGRHQHQDRLRLFLGLGSLGLL